MLPPRPILKGQVPRVMIIADHQRLQVPIEGQVHLSTSLALAVAALVLDPKLLAGMDPNMLMFAGLDPKSLAGIDPKMLRLDPRAMIGFLGLDSKVLASMDKSVSKQPFDF